MDHHEFATPLARWFCWLTVLWLVTTAASSTTLGLSAVADITFEMTAPYYQPQVPSKTARRTLFGTLSR